MLHMQREAAELVAELLRNLFRRRFRTMFRTGSASASSQVTPGFGPNRAELRTESPYFSPCRLEEEVGVGGSKRSRGKSSARSAVPHVGSQPADPRSPDPARPEAGRERATGPQAGLPRLSLPAPTAATHSSSSPCFLARAIQFVAVRVCRPSASATAFAGGSRTISASR